jgi:hypothetical protein
LEQAVAMNHHHSFCDSAMALGGEIQTREGLTWTYIPSSKNASIFFNVVELRKQTVHPPDAWGGRSVPHINTDCKGWVVV